MAWRRRRAHSLLLLLAAIAVPEAIAQEQGSSHIEVREFWVGGQTPAASAPSLPPQAATDGRCDVQCQVPAAGLSFVVVDVRGRWGEPFQYSYERRGCPVLPPDPDWPSQPNPYPEMGEKKAIGRRVLWVEGCASVVVRPATVHVWADPWTCTHRPSFVEPWVIDLPDVKLVPDAITVPFSNPLPSSFPVAPFAGEDEEPASEYRAFTECTLAHCRAVEWPHPCVADPWVQATGTVILEW